MVSGPNAERHVVSVVIQKLLLVGTTLLACLGLLEIGLRVTGRFAGNPMECFYAPDRGGYRLQKNISTKVFWPAATFTVNTDQYGFRSRKPGPRDIGARPYFAVLGSSDTFGMGLNYDDSFVGVLARKLDSRQIDTVNMAVGGHMLDCQANILREFVQTSKSMPENVLICLNPLMISEFDQKYDWVIVHNGYLFPRHQWRMTYVKKILSNNVAVYDFFRNAFRNVQMRCFHKRDFDVAYWYGTYSITNSVRSPQRTKEFLEHLKNLEDYIRSLHATPICCFSPTVGGFRLNKLKAEGKLRGLQFDTEFYPDLIRDHCRREGIQFINTEPMLQELYDDGAKLNTQLDAHFNAATSRLVGEHIYVSLEAGGARYVKTVRNGR